MDRSAEAIFFHARERTDPAERDAYLAGACGDDLALRVKVEALLRADRDAGGFMRSVSPENQPLDSASATADIDPGRVIHDPPRGDPNEEPGQMIGRYKLLQHIGEGGFGAVWMAEQKRPVKRRVALKVIKLGMDTKQVIARFEAERQALAMMDHPNIAKVFDAGCTDTGRPYFVMELVRGVPIVEYCDTEKLDTRGRLGLFTRVCQAIQHAHQKGIIHRDIKPSNVLVTMHDGEPVPKVIDFGIAKATNTELTARTLFTEHRQMVGTPAYMSPEQAEMSGLDIDTRADIYSLGVLLYELLTGTTPFSVDDLLSKGFAEMMRIIREDEPHKPSTRLATLGPDATQTAERRRADVRRLGLSLRGDLDWIVMKCLEKDRTRRYETANGLAEDIRRHLTDEPVVAGPPAAGYRLGKFIKRNRGPVLAGGSIAGVLVVAVVTLFFLHQWAMSEWRRAEDLAHAERERSNRALAAMTQMLGESGVFDLNGVAVGETTRLDLETSDEIYFDVTRHEVDADTIVPRWIHEGREGDPSEKIVELLASEAVHWTTLGMERARTRAEQLQLVADFQSRMLRGVEPAAMGRSILDELERQVRLRVERTWVAGADGTPRTPTQAEVDEAMARYAEVARPANAADIAREMLDASLLAPAIEALEQEYQDAPKVQAALFATIGRIYDSIGMFGQAERALRRAVELRRAHSPGEPVLASTLSSLSTCIQHQARYDEARVSLEEAHTIYRQTEGETSGNATRLLRRLGSLAFYQGDSARAERLGREALAIAEQRGDDAGIRAALWVIGSAMGGRGEFDSAVELYTRLLLLTEQATGAGSRSALSARFNLAEALENARRPAKAAAHSARVLAERRELLGDRHPGTAYSLVQLGRLKWALSETHAAEQLLREGLEIRVETHGDAHPHTLGTMRDLATVLRINGVESEARTLEDRAIAASRVLHGPGHPKALSLLDSLAAMALSHGEYRRAAMLGRAAWSGWAERAGEQDDRPAHAAAFLAEVHDAWHAADPRAGHDRTAAEWRARIAPAPAD